VTPSTVHHSDDHDRIGFHPACPVCRQDRLFAVLSPDLVFSRRLRVVLATGVLALSTAATGTSVATEPDNQQEGVVVPEMGPPPSGDTSGDTTVDDTPNGPIDDLGQDSGGETALPLEVDPVPAPPQQHLGDNATTDDGSADSAPLETEPLEDPDAELLLTSPDTGAPNPEDSPVPPAEPLPPTDPPPTPVPPPADGAPDTPEASPPAAERDEQTRRAARRHHNRRSIAKHHKRNGHRHRKHGATTGAPLPPTPVEVPAQPVAQPAEPAPTADAPSRAGGSGRFRVVRRGESLWSIAADLLGPAASAAAIASEVHRLWNLNAKRIGTGDPNVLRVGVTLRLR
jgi:hypothetical protein